MSPPVLAYKTDKDSRFRGRNKSFLLSDVQFVPSPRNDFAADDGLFALLPAPRTFRPISGPEDGRIRRPNGRPAMQIPEIGKVISRSLAEIPDPGSIMEEFPLAGYPPAHYRSRSPFWTQPKAGTSSRPRFDFDIPMRDLLHRPWVLSLPQPPSDDPSFANILGTQYSAPTRRPGQGPAPARNGLHAAIRLQPNTPWTTPGSCCRPRTISRAQVVAAPSWATTASATSSRSSARPTRRSGELRRAIVHYQGIPGPLRDEHRGAERHRRMLPQAWATPPKPWSPGSGRSSSNPNQPDLKDQVKALKEKK